MPGAAVEGIRRLLKLAPGEPGALGVNRVERAGGRVEALSHIGSVPMAPGDVFVVETLGGGDLVAALIG